MTQNPLTEQASAQPSEADKNRPWWRYPIVWLVVGGPAAVVVASFFTMGLAIKQVNTPSQAPAVQGRNHASEQGLQPADK